MKLQRFYHEYEKYLPPSLACEWDHDGVQCMTDKDREVRRIVCTLDITEAVVSHAIECGADLIVSHHPLLFKPLYALTDETPASSCLMQLAMHGIGVFSFHTRADAVSGGTSDLLAARIGLVNVRESETEEGPLLRVGTLPSPMSVRDFAAHVRDALGADAVNLAARDGDKEILRVAVSGGEGGDFIADAARAGADVFVSGRIGYHRMLDAAQSEMAAIEVGHYASEREIVFFLAQIAKQIDKDAEIVLYAPKTLTVLTKEK